jgi:LPXTG-site transpeptidase (sortase) family protein
MNEEKDNQNEQPHPSWLDLMADEVIPPPPPIEEKRETHSIQHSHHKKTNLKLGPVFSNSLMRILKTIFTFGIIFVICFTVLNFPALITKTNYFFNHSDTVTQAAEKTITFNSKNNNLFIPKISVDVPISWNVSSDNTLTALENGVAQYAGTALPGQNGNLFISGHSSYYWWNEGSYKEVFALLDKLEKGDKIYVSYEKKIYVYVVTDKKTVSPSSVEVLDPTNTKTLSLMTCVPVGTNLNRLIVTAKQI